MKKIIKEIRLKKDTPDHRAGERFVLMSNNGIYEIDAGEDDPAVFYGGDIKNFDEWFEGVSDKWPQYGDSYYYLDSAGEVSLTQFVFSCSCVDESRREIGNTFKTRNATCQFARFLKAMEVIRHDKGFMKKGDDDDIWAVVYDSNNELTPRSVYGTFKEFAGMAYFDTEEHAIISINEHSLEWHDILRHDWSKGEDEEDEN